MKTPNQLKELKLRPLCYTISRDERTFVFAIDDNTSLYINSTQGIIRIIRGRYESQSSYFKKYTFIEEKTIFSKQFAQTRFWIAILEENLFLPFFAYESFQHFLTDMQLNIFHGRYYLEIKARNFGLFQYLECLIYYLSDT